MPANEQITTQLDAPQIAILNDLLQKVITALLPVSQNLTPEEKTKFGSINEENKLIVGKVMDYRVQQPTLSSPDVDWDLFTKNWVTRSGFALIENLCRSIIEMSSEARILHDYSLFKNSIVDYDFSKYKANSTASGAAFSTKVDDIKQFFGNPNGNQAPKPIPPAE